MLPPLAAETMFHIGSFPITNSYINSTIALVLFIILAYTIKRLTNKNYISEKAPKGFLNLFEVVIEQLLILMDGVTKSRKKSLLLIPIIGTLFLFILVSNWLGLLPGTGSIGIYQMHHGSIELIPLLRPANTDLNMTVAMSVLAVAASHLFGIFAIGFFKYINKYIKFQDIYKAIKTLNPLKILIAFVEFFVGILETVAEAAKVLSLSLRLFGNIFAGEVLLTVIGGLMAYFAPLPFMALEILVGAVQAVVFSMLALVYLTLALDEPHGAHNEEHALEHEQPKKIEIQNS
jgi:F-type H+-transporting ATPase subunit a